MSTPALLQLQDLRVSFGGTEVVHGLNLEIKPRECLALVGESGSGKSVTALSILRLLEGAQWAGQVRWQGQNLLSQTEQSMQRIRGDEIAMIFQEPMTALNPLMTVGQQISEVLQLKKLLPQRLADERAIQLLDETGIDDAKRRFGAYPHQLSGGQRQRAMVAMALACEPKLLLADEPTTALDASLRLQMLNLLMSLQQKTGMAILLITHDLALVRHFAHRVAVMEKGHLVEQGALNDILTRPQHPYTQKLLSSQPSRDGLMPFDGPTSPILQVSRLRVRYPIAGGRLRDLFRRQYFTAVHAADFSVAQGTTLGVMGESGSGKSSLAQAVLGLLPFDGLVDFCGQTWQGSPRKDQTLRRRVQVVFQDPYGSLSPRLTVRDIVSEGLKLHQPELGVADVDRKVRDTLEEVGLTTEEYPELLNRYPHAFSGGQRQRIALARALVVEPQLLILDEPTSALDVTVQQQILKLLQYIQKKRGMSYLLITHDVEVLRAMSHAVLVMHQGQIVESGDAMQVLEKPVHPYTQSLLKAFVDH